MLSFLGGWERQVQIILLHFLPFVSTEHNPESQSATAFHPLNPSASPFNNSLPPHPRLRLIHGFLPPEEADWAFSKLLAELPWSQKTNYRQGRSTIMSPRIDHRAILYTAYRREQTDFFFFYGCHVGIGSVYQLECYCHGTFGTNVRSTIPVQLTRDSISTTLPILKLTC